MRAHPRFLSLLVAAVSVVSGGCAQTAAPPPSDGAIDAPTADAPGSDSAVADALLGDASGAGDGPALGGPRCSYPRCLLDLTAACTPSGTCVIEDTGPAGSVCYQNGVKFLEALDRARGTLDYRVTRPDGMTTCYAASGVLGPTGTLRYRDGADRTFATGTLVGGVLTITCEGMSPTVVGADCLPVPRPVGAACPRGTCR